MFVISYFSFDLSLIEMEMVCGCACTLALVLSCYYPGRTSRFRLMSSLIVSSENNVLEVAVAEAKAALRNDAADTLEKDAVKRGLCGRLSSIREDRSSSSVLENLRTSKAEQFQNVRRIVFDDIHLLQLIGRGGNGEVLRAHYLGTIVVCKRLLRHTISVASIHEFSQEITLLATLRHP